MTVLRQATATDRGPPAALCFGTKSGSAFSSEAEGENWPEIARHVPAILCLEFLARI